MENSLTLVNIRKQNRPRRERPGLSRRASMSSLPTYSAEHMNGLAQSKEQIYEGYKNEKKALKKAHKAAEKEFYETVTNVEMAELSGLAEQEEQTSYKINLETFERPKASRRARRASMGITLKILDAPQSPTLELEDIVMPTSPVVPMILPTLPSSFDRRAGLLSKSFSCSMFDAEALAGWKTITFEDGPIGLLLEPTAGHKACRVTGFADDYGPSPARATGQVELDDVIVKINLTAPKSYKTALELLAQGGKRSITFRPAYPYELFGVVDGHNKISKKKMKKSSSSRKLFVEDESEKSDDPLTKIMDIKKKKKKQSKKDKDDGEDENKRPTQQYREQPEAIPEREFEEEEEEEEEVLDFVVVGLEDDKVVKAKYEMDDNEKDTAKKSKKKEKKKSNSSDA